METKGKGKKGKKGKKSRSSTGNKKYLPNGIKVLYEDRDLLIINKVAGLLSVASEREKKRAALPLMTHWVRKGCAKSKKEIFIVHRLDRETSGVLIFAKSREIRRLLQENWDKVKKKYMAIVYGRMKNPEGVMSSYLAENEAQRVYSTKDESVGKLSHTEYRVIRETRRQSLLELTLLTGRKNQIRVHLSDSGHPIVGDKKYGKRGQKGKGMALHAHSVCFPHPKTGKEIFCEAIVPAIFYKQIGSVEENPSEEKPSKEGPSEEIPSKEGPSEEC